MLRAIQRHRDVYEDNGKELRRTKVRRFRPSMRTSPLTVMQASVKQALDQMNLLSGVRNDIEYAFYPHVTLSLLQKIPVPINHPQQIHCWQRGAGSTVRTQ
jgi:Golgi SNAP receptor complex protein 1